MIRRSSNPYLDEKSFFKMANLNLTNPLVICFYGVDEMGVIREAIPAYASLVDETFRLVNFFDADLKDEGFVAEVKELEKFFRAVLIEETRQWDS